MSLSWDSDSEIYSHTIIFYNIRWSDGGTPTTTSQANAEPDAGFGGLQFGSRVNAPRAGLSILHPSFSDAGKEVNRAHQEYQPKERVDFASQLSRQAAGG